VGCDRTCARLRRAWWVSLHERPAPSVPARGLSERAGLKGRRTTETPTKQAQERTQWSDEEQRPAGVEPVGTFLLLVVTVRIDSPFADTSPQNAPPARIPRPHSEQPLGAVDPLRLPSPSVDHVPTEEPALGSRPRDLVDCVRPIFDRFDDFPGAEDALQKPLAPSSFEGSSRVRWNPRSPSAASPSACAKVRYSRAMSRRANPVRSRMRLQQSLDAAGDEQQRCLYVSQKP